jgi:B12 binding domain
MPPGHPAHAAAAEVGSPAALLYIHPRGHLNDLVVPAGAISALNAAAGPKLGRYAFEVSDAEIRAAQVVAMDLHWALGLGGLIPMVARIRALRPEVPIVVGGISASHFPAELLEQVGVDYVIRGDAEASFPALVEALRAGRLPGSLPNVWSRAGAGPRQRLSSEAFDAADPLTADWFPSLSMVRDWPAAACPMSATIPVARGCALRCPTCNGSHAAVSGEEVLLRSPEAFARLLDQACELGLRSLRLLLGKVPAKRLTALLKAAARRGPFRFDEGLGLYICTPPSPADLEALEATFEARITLSLIPPAEHVPPPPPQILAREEAAWREVADRVGRSQKLQLDIWAAGAVEAAAAAAWAGPLGPRVGVNLGSVWSLSRPGGPDHPTLLELRAAVEPLWTFYAARLLSPALEPLLAPFRLLDELESDPAAQPPVSGMLRGWQEVILARWRAQRLPTLPGLEFVAVPARMEPGATPGRRFGGTRLHGAAAWLPSGTFRLRAEASVPLRIDEAHDAVRLRGELEFEPQDDLVAILPRPPPGVALEGFAEEVAAHGLVAVLSPPGGARRATLRISLRIQEAEVALLDASGAPLQRGRIELGYLRPPPPAP